MKLKDFTIISGIAIIIYLLLTGNKKNSGHPNKEKVVYYTSDTTIIREKQVQVPIYIPKPELVYFDTSTNTVTNDTSKLRVNSYTDSFSNDDITIRYTDIVKGSLLNKSLNYTLKQKEITNTIKTIQYNQYNSLYLTGEAGGNSNTFNNISIGLLYTSPKGYSINYRYNLLNNTHNIGSGIRLLKR